MFQDGSQDFSYVEKVFQKATSKPIYIIKSTILPGSTQRLSQKYKNLKLFFHLNF